MNSSSTNFVLFFWSNKALKTDGMNEIGPASFEKRYHIALQLTLLMLAPLAKKKTSARCTSKKISYPGPNNVASVPLAHKRIASDTSNTSMFCNVRLNREGAFSLMGQKVSRFKVAWQDKLCYCVAWSPHVWQFRLKDTSPFSHPGTFRISPGIPSVDVNLFRILGDP